jgi:guanosine-3',5'-bis(diphosphate) 3'-pyrophosphohydrolase
MASDA